MKVEVYLELNPPEFYLGFLNDHFDVSCKLEADLNIECQIQREILITATLAEKYELEE